MVWSLASQPRQIIPAIWQQNRGSVLVSSLLVMVGLAALGTAAITVTSLGSQISGSYVTSTQAFYVAEAGVNRVLGKYRTNPTLYTVGSSASDLGLTATKPGSANFGTNFAYWFPTLTYEASNPPQYVDVESHGAVIGSNTLSKVVVRIAYTDGPFQYGAFGDDEVTIGGTGYVDSYDACTAPYDPMNPGSNGDIGTNATGCSPQKCIQVSGSSGIAGDAVFGVGGDQVTDIDDPVQISGSKTALTSPEDMTPRTDPGGGTADTLDLTSSDTKTFTAGTYRLPYIKVQSSAKTYIDGDVTLYVDGALDVGGSGEIVVQPGGSLTIYVSGDADIGGGGLVNQTTIPSNFIVYGTSTSTNIKIHGSAEFYGAIYAPTADIEVTGNSEVYGSFIGQTVVTNTNAGIHYDECLGNVGTAFRVVFWRPN